jgi:hypothetical protein
VAGSGLIMRLVYGEAEAEALWMHKENPQAKRALAVAVSQRHSEQNRTYPSRYV